MRYADTIPDFGDYAVGALVYTVDDAIPPLTLRKANGDETKHELTSLVLPPG